MGSFVSWRKTLALLPILVYSVLNVSARALPPSHGSPKSIVNRESHSPFTPYQPGAEATWIICEPTIADGVTDLGCALVSHDTPVHRRSVILLGRDSHLHHTNVDETPATESPAASLYPCRIRNTSGARRLRCGRANRASRKILDDSTYELLISELLNGLPISVGPNMIPSPEFDTANYFVQMYPVDNSYDLRLLSTSTPSEPETKTEAQSVSPRSIPSSNLLLNSREQNENIHPTSEGQSFVQKRMDSLLALDIKGILYCWYHENKYDTEVELNCGIDVEAEAIIAVFDDEDEDDAGDDDGLGSSLARAQQDSYQDKLVKYLYSLTIPPLIALYNSQEGSEAAWLQVPEDAARLLVIRLSELIGDTNFDIASFNWTPVIKGVMSNLRDAAKQKNGSENMDSIALFEMLLEHYLEVYSGNYTFPDDEMFQAGISTESSDGHVGFFNYDKKSEEHVRRELIWSRQERDTSHIGSKYEDNEGSQSGIIIDRWFRCFDGSGSKVLCEIPDWYDLGQENAENLRVKRHNKFRKRRQTGDESLVGQEFPAHFSAGPPRLWQNCKFGKHGGKYLMKCPLTPHPEYVGAVGEDTTGDYKDPLVRRGVITPPLSSLLANPTDIGTPPLSDSSQNTLPLTDTPRVASSLTSPGTPPHTAPLALPSARPAFGKMGDTLAYIGFFTLLTLFAVIMFLVASNLLLTLQDVFNAFKGWKDRQYGSKSRGTAVGESDLDQGPNHPAPAYISSDNFYSIGGGVSVPVSAALTEIRRLSMASTGSQPVGEGGDTIKRKKVAMRGVVDEEIGII
ncbi:hypothetical protein DFP73DRAFT_599753 [Morchella snyderi]|nr:hypothetical protein DFP73DRAFT_599753 [Morchella snyderi]